MIDDKDPFIKAIWLHYTYFLMLNCSSYRKDSETLQMDVLVRLYPDEIRALLVASSMMSKLPYSMIISLFIILTKAQMDEQQKRQSCSTGQNTSMSVLQVVASV